MTQHSKRALKILHTADVHLDCDSYGTAEQRQAHRTLYYRCFQTIIERAKQVLDVYAWERDATGHLRAGRNPYAAIGASRVRLEVVPDLVEQAAEAEAVARGLSLHVSYRHRAVLRHVTLEAANRYLQPTCTSF